MTQVMQANYDRLVGKPDGPNIFVPEYGCEVGSFTDRRADLEERDSNRAYKVIMHHVPRSFRGPFKPTQLSNYDPSVDYPMTWDGWARCTAQRAAQNKRGTRKGDGQCERKAMNRYPFCAAHGGKLHPLDKVTEIIPDPTKMSRQELLKFGFIDVDDLDDEELIKGMARRPDGTFPEIRGKAVIPKDIYDKMVSRLFERCNESMRQNVLAATEALSAIALGDAYEASDRLNAIKELLSRTLGKPKDVVDINVGLQSPFEQILAGVQPISREESRKKRAELEGSGSLMKDLGFAVEAGPALCDDCGDKKENGKCPNCDVNVSSQKLSETLSVLSTNAPENLRSERPAMVECERALTKEELKERIQKGRNRRFAARAQGRETLPAHVLYVRQETYKGNGVIHINWIHPDDVKVPSSVKAKETRNRNKERRKA